MNQLIYHYCSNQKMASILSGKTLRMSDITKSNDYDEVIMFFPGILDAMIDIYEKNPFPFQYEGKENREAVGRLFQLEYDFLSDEFDKGGVTNFVVCFCEQGDILSQWRGYADNGKGCSIGFSVQEIEQYCNKYTDVLKLEKVEYKTSEELNDIILNKALFALDELSNMRNWLLTNIKSINSEKKMDIALEMSFHYLVSTILMNSLKYKNYMYHEEKEWRLFFNQQIYKLPSWMYGDVETETFIFGDMARILRNKIDFNVTENDIIPYYPIDIFEISDMPIKEIFLGPNSKILLRDFDLMVAKFGYKNVKFINSKIPYRG